MVVTLTDGGPPAAAARGDALVSPAAGHRAGDQLGISFSSVARIWRRWDIQPHRVETFKFSTDPRLEANIQRQEVSLVAPIRCLCIRDMLCQASGRPQQEDRRPA